MATYFLKSIMHSNAVKIGCWLELMCVLTKTISMIFGRKKFMECNREPLN